MIVEARVNSVINIDIESDEAFVILCKTLQMDFVLNENIEFFVRQDAFGDNCVYYIKDGHDEKYDERGDLFIALRNVAVELFPNISFRNANYIYKE
ncbi:MAG: hypothetical protein J6A25_07285 [Lachnospiraceae bacterium]|nr:hypothetical protein [Lachnospiraceae bacterium]